MQQFDFFISYSQKDAAMANRLYDEITARGYSCFQDKKNIQAGQVFPAAIAEAIMCCKHFIFLASANSYDSKFTINEVTYALKQLPKEAIYPYLIDQQPMPHALQYVLASANWRKSSEVSVGQFVDEILNGGTAPDGTGTPADLAFPPLTKAILVAYFAGFSLFAVAAFLLIVLPFTAWFNWPTVLSLFCAIWGAISCYYILLRKKWGYWSLLPMAAPVVAMWMVAPAANFVYAAIYALGVAALFVVLKVVKHDGHNGWDCLH